MANYDFYRQTNINNFKVDIMVDLVREKIILQFGDGELIKFIESLDIVPKNYMKVTIKEGDIM